MLGRTALLCVLVTSIAEVESWTVPASLGAAPVLASRWILENPHHSTAAISCVRGLIGDCLAQCLEGSKRFDARRTATYVSWCNLVAELYTRPWNCIIVPRYFPAIVGNVLCWHGLLTSVAIDNFVLSPFVYYPCYYLFKDAAAGCFNLRNTLAQYRREFWPQMRLLWAVWIPTQLVSFSLVPPHLRVAFSGAVGTLWVTALSANTKLLATMGDACVADDYGTKCSVPDNQPKPLAEREESIDHSWLMAALAKNWVFVLSFVALQTATGAMFAVGILWLSLLLWSGLS